MFLSFVKAPFFSATGRSLLEKTDLDKVFFHHIHLAQLGISNFNSENKRPVLTISYKGKKIYRQFKEGSTFGIHSGEIAMLDKDRRYLGITDDHKEVRVQRANFMERIMYYLVNPRQEFRIAIILSLISIFLTVAIELVKLL